MKTRAFALVLIFVLALTSLTAQQKKADERTSFRSQSNLVLMPIQVRSKGQHVAGLTQDKFTILQDGKEQKIAVFEEIRTTTQRLQRVPVGPKEFTNELQGTPDTARYTVIAIDRINTGTIDMNRVKEGLMKFLSQASDTGEPVRLVAIEMRGIRMLQDFTTDPKAIAAAFQGAKGASGQALHGDASMLTTREQLTAADAASGAASAAAAASGSADDAATAAKMAQYLDTLEKSAEKQEDMLIFQQRSARISSLEALQQLALSLNGLPGRKSLVWVSSGYPFASGTRTVAPSGQMTPYNFGNVLEATSLDAYTTNLLNAANVAMYPVDARGTVNTAFQAMDVSQKYSPTYALKQGLQSANRDVLTTFRNLAEATGGKACVERTDLGGCFKDAMDDAHDYYMVGFYLDRANTKEGWHKLQAKVSEKGASVHGRAGFLYPMPEPDKTHAADMNLAVTSLLNDAGVPFRGQWTTTDARGDKKAAHFEIAVSPDAKVIDMEQNKLNIEFAGIARAKDGSVVGQFAQKIEKTLPADAVANIQKMGIQYKNLLVLAPGEYLVRFVVRDNNTGSMGTANSLLKVE